ncbi:late embryogenesis abundant protein At1g64065-like [Fagus crenata]
MAEKINQKPRSDEELATPTLQSEELRRKKRIKLAIYIAAFVVFQTIVITVFALTVMRVKTPKVRLGTVTFHNVNISTQTPPNFDLSFTTQVRVKNTNFGPYKYDGTNVTFMYQGVTVGQFTIPKGKAGFRSTKKVSVTVNVNSNALPSTTSLGSELGAGVLTLNSHARLSGKVELMFVMKKKKSAEMNCNMTIVLSTKEVQALSCE